MVKAPKSFFSQSTSAIATGMFGGVMSLGVYLRDGEMQDSLLKRFQRSVQMSGILREVKANSHFVSKGDAARIKARNSARRRRRQGY
jgi:ribosomal protein S21